MKEVIIIGGGISGLSVAWRLINKGFKVKIIEADDRVGGLAKSIKIDNYYFDIGPHSFFSEDKEVFESVMSLFKGEESAMPFSKRTVKMWFRNRYVDYPLSAKSVLFQMGILSPFLSFLSFAKSYIKNIFVKEDKNKPLTIEDWAINNFGKYLFLNFFKPYTEQFWKIPTSELSHRVIPSSRKMDFAKTLKHLLISKYLELSKREPGKLSLVQRDSLPSYYPKKGFGEIGERIAKKIKENNMEIYFNEEVKEIEVNDKKLFTIKTENKSFKSDYLISTIPINTIFPKFNPKPESQILNDSSKLEYLSLILVYLITKKKNVINCQYCYYIDRPYNRISEMNNFSNESSPSNENILSVEISCLKGSELWNLSKDEIYELCITSIEKDKIIKKEDIEDFKVIKVPSVYPIYRKDYEKYLNKTNEYFSKIKKFSSIGRQGQFYYGDIDQMVRLGFDAADKIVNSNLKDN
ncbi:FAD-dependent oxidoreductase [Candidatus Pelagibacter sp. Uisw_134_02]|uniref:FAD-dependent oxidoreductase n=1 Tax=Candidatus Pelagibacter sp. Uisw_134_02 TaxID=3230990 RepID=UPI0039E7C5B2